jgi:hypothetical protein
LGDDRDASDDAREGGAPASSAELEDYPPRPEHSRSQPLSDAEILDGGDETRAFYVSSSDHRPCGFAIGDTEQAVVVVCRRPTQRL